MQDSNPLIQQIAQELEASSKTSPTEVGRGNAQQQSRREYTASDAHVDALNEIFALFRINYHNQYYKAYSDTQVLSQIKKLWLESLSQFTPELILQGARKVIEESEYLPSLNRMIRACQGDPEKFGLVDAHSAYVEACRAPSPKATHHWSHAAVYHAGCASDWFFLASNSEKNAFPIFERHYLKLCERVIAGEVLSAPNIAALPETIETPLSSQENQKRLETLRKSLDL
jgi:Replication protein P